jgi:TPR repeat protein
MVRRRTGSAAAIAAALLALVAAPAALADDTASLRTSAEAGDPAAAFALANLYYHGQGVARDYGAAMGWFRKAAEKGNPGAAFALGEMNRKGEGVRRDGAEAARWLQKAADAGYSDAETELAEMYAKGDGVAKDPAQAAAWYTKAAAQGDIDPDLSLKRLNVEAASESVEAANAPRDRAGGTPRRWFSALMDSVFGHGAWRETGGYRTQAQENALRAGGAETVLPGQVSRHTIGTPDAPGAYDVVVANMTMDQAAAKLRRCRERFNRIYVEAAHGPQGPHLHLEPVYAPGDVFAEPGRREARAELQPVSYTRP